MSKIKYVQLEPGAFLSDIDFQMMSAEQRGVFWSIILYLYCNNGKLKNDPVLLSQICNASKDFDFDKIMGKFQVKHGFVGHKRVDEELGKAEVKREQAIRAAKTRWDKDTDAMHEQCGRNADASSPAMPTKLNLTKGNITKDKQLKTDFDIARKTYPNNKRGLDAEYKYFKKVCKEWEKTIPLLLPAIEKQILWRKTAVAGDFRPPWKDFKSWIFNEYWTLEINDVSPSTSSTGRPSGPITDDHPDFYKTQPRKTAARIARDAKVEQQKADGTFKMLR